MIHINFVFSTNVFILYLRLSVLVLNEDLIPTGISSNERSESLYVHVMLGLILRMICMKEYHSEEILFKDIIVVQNISLLPIGEILKKNLKFP